MNSAVGSLTPYCSVRDLIALHARARPDKVYCTAAESGRTLTYRQLFEYSNQIARFLHARGFKAGDRVSVLADNCLSQLLVFHAVQAYGATVNLVNCEVNARNVAQIVYDVDPRLVLVHRGLPAEMQSIARAAGVECYSCDDDPQASADRAVDDDFFQALRGESAAPDAPCVHGSPTEMALINYTSGTTAKPKGVCCSHQSYFYMSESVVDGFRLTEHDTMLEYRALTWCSPQVLSVTSMLQLGGSFVLAKRFSGSHFFDWIRKYGVTVSAGVPTAITMLLERPHAVTRADLPTLRYMTTSTSPIPPETFEAFQKRYAIPLVQGCGMSEAGFMFSNDPLAPRRGPVGRPQKNLRARFIDEQGNDTPVGVEGELVIDGPQIFEGYLMGRADIQPRAKWFVTGDLGYFDQDGFAFLTGRKKDLIIRGGVNIAPLEITAYLCEHPDVLEAATIGVPDKIYGEAVACFVVPHPGRSISVDALLTHLRPRLSDYKMPQTVTLLEQVPKTDRGKPFKDGLMKIWEERVRPTLTGA